MTVSYSCISFFGRFLLISDHGCLTGPTSDTAEDISQNIEEQKMEVMSLESMYPEAITILSEPTDGDSESSSGLASSDINAYTLQVTVSVDLTDVEKVTVEASRFIEDQPYVEDGTDASNTTELRGNKPQFQRSISGRRWQASFSVNQLPPLCLDLVLPESYPSLTPPQFTLSCLWLSLPQLSVLCRELDKIWEDNQGMAVMYLWMDWLQNDALSCLGLEDTVYLTAPNPGDEPPGVHRDQRALPECSSLDAGIAKLLRYNFEATQREFCQSPQSCAVCFDEKLGDQFYRLTECTHHFCVECITAYCDYHVKEGTVMHLNCPIPKCSTSLPPDIVQTVLGHEEYDRWERLVLQNSLDTMGDIEWCPRCNNPVIREAEAHLKLAHCTTCFYSFCTACNEPWHQGSKCEDDQEEDSDEEKDKNSRSIRKEKRKRKHLDKLSTGWIKNFTKPCPKCSCPIEKNGGCNKVTCSKCYESMCWICGNIIKDYSHFSACTLWSNDYTIPNVIQRRPELPEGAKRVKEYMREYRDEGIKQLVHCPRCHQRNLKENRNNHIKCHSCHSQFCFMCRQLLQPPVTAHYKVGSACVQHSD